MDKKYLIPLWVSFLLFLFVMAGCVFLSYGIGILVSENLCGCLLIGIGSGFLINVALLLFIKLYNNENYK